MSEAVQKEKKLVFLLGSPEGITISLAELLIANRFKVCVLAENSETFKSKVKHLANQPDFAVKNVSEIYDDSVPDWTVFVDPYFWGDKSVKLFRQCQSLFLESKTVVLVYDGSPVSQLAGKLAATVITTKNVFGPRMAFCPTDPVSEMLTQALTKKEILVSKKEVAVNPVSIDLLARDVLDAVLIGKESHRFVGKKIPLSTIAFAVAKLSDACQLKFTDSSVVVEVAEEGNIDVEIEETVSRTLKATMVAKIAFPRRADFRFPKVTVPKIKIPRLPKLPVFPKIKVNISRRTVFISKIFAAAFLMALLPVWLLLLSFGLIYLHQPRAGQVAAVIAEEVFGYYSKLPVSSRELIYFRSFAANISAVSGVGATLQNIAREGTAIVEGLMTDKNYSLSTRADKLAVDIDLLYKQASFLESEIRAQGLLGLSLVRSLYNQFELSKRREELLTLKKMSALLPDMFGINGERNYLLLLQNNMELRPTGGFIGSFALIKFNKGKLADMSVYDVYSADGQLKGHVEPPDPIKRYLKEANWYLRDSNWDPDFSAAAEKAEWFLSKEMDVDVDGVIAIDLEVVKSLLSATGPISLPDFGREVTADNLYEITQSEVEEDFFAGSRKKANFLTALTNALMARITDSGVKNPLPLGKAIYNGLLGRHIQISVHDQGIQSVIRAVGWTGEISPVVCESTNCYSDWGGFVEANLGVNKANLFVNRLISVTANIDGEYIRRQAKLTLINRANPVLGEKATYRTYVRLLTPVDAKSEGAKISRLGKEEYLETDSEYLDNRLEIGAWVEVLPGKTVELTFDWKSYRPLAFGEQGNYSFFWRKQAGTSEDKLLLDLNWPKGLKLSATYDPSLTTTGLVRYNTVLSKDFSTNITW